MGSYTDPSDQAFSDDSSILADCMAAGLVTGTFLRLEPLRRQAVLQAILAEAAEGGMVGVNIKLVAKRSGIPVGSLYQYFGERDRMLRFACRYSGTSLARYIEYWTPALSQLPVLEGLQAYLAAGLAWAEQERLVMKVFAQTAYQISLNKNPDGSVEQDAVRLLVSPVAAALQDMIRCLLEACAGRGELRSGLDLEAATRLVNLTLIGLGDAQLLPGLNQYFRVFAANQPISETTTACLEILCAGLTGGASMSQPKPFTERS